VVTIACVCVIFMLTGPVSGSRPLLGDNGFRDDLHAIGGQYSARLEEPQAEVQTSRADGFGGLVKGIIRTYQFVLSSQDKPVCNFAPSCSDYAIEAISHYGLFHGILMAGDRILRCNGSRAGRFKIDDTIGRWQDPVESHYLGDQ
jgi:hypothetical protein